MSEPATAAEPEMRELRDAADLRRIPVIPPLATTSGRKQIALLNRALKLADSDTPKALELAKKALEIDGGLAHAHHIAGLLYDKIGQISVALEHYEAAWKLDPQDAEIYQNIGLAAWRLDMLEAAEKFFRISRQMEPHRLDSVVNLACVLRDQARFEDAIEILRQAIYADQSNSVLWNTLGSVLLESGDPFQAETFYREALNHKPDFARAWHNLAYALDLQGDTPGALAAYDRALSYPMPPTDQAYTRHGRAFSLLAAGRLEEGWKEYDIRTRPVYPQATVFMIAAPRWDLDPAKLAGKRVLMVGEQGIGDEVLYMNAATDMEGAIGPDGHLIIACAQRLVPLISRAFPRATVGGHNTFSAEARKFRTVPWLEKIGGCDLWTPMADTICAFRKSIDAFPDTRAWMPADPARVAHMRAQLDALGPGLKVGVIWKSMLMSANRAKYFSPFAQWAPVLKTPGAVFVNLQYGDVAAELTQAKAELGVAIHEIEGLDVKNDLDGVAALGAALDISIGPATASTNLTAVAGGETWLLGYKNQWSFLGTGRLPYYSSVRVFSPPGWGQWDAAMQDVADELARRAGAAQGAKAA